MGMKDNGKAFATKSDSDNKSDTSCRRYTAQLDDEYSVSINGGSDLISTINTMWEETGLRMWARAQYGSGRNASNVFCRVLEFRAGAPASDMAHLTNLSAGHDIVSADAIAFHPSLAFIDDEGKQSKDTDPKDGVENGTYTKQMDRVVTMWQACGHFSDGWNVRNGWQFIGAIQGKNRGFDNATWKQMCAAVFTGSSSGDVYGATANGGRIGGQDPPDTAKSDTSTAAHDKSWNAVGTIASTKYTVTSASAQSQTSDKDKKGVLYSYAGVKPGVDAGRHDNRHAERQGIRQGHRRQRPQELRHQHHVDRMRPCETLRVELLTRPVGRRLETREEARHPDLAGRDARRRPV